MFSSNTSQVSNDATYIEDVFSTWLYTGNDSSQTITNGIDLAGEGGLVWIKNRTSAVEHALFDTNRGVYKILSSNLTDPQYDLGAGQLSAFNSNGFSLGGSNTVNGNFNYASWTFRKQPKFFDVVTYTGNGASQNIAHNLGSVPGCMIVKRTDSTSDWSVYHRSLTNAQYLRLNLTNAVGSSSTVWDSTTPTSTEFTLGASTANASGGTYVAYLFAHDAGGFGEDGTDNVISCGSYTGNGSTQDINLGYEAQWVLVKNATTAGWDWYTIDNMRGFVVNPASPNFTKSLSPNTSNAESDLTAISPSSTGFRLNSSAGAFNQSGQTYIYIAIRRGPMKTPTSGTSVFAPQATAGATDGTPNSNRFTSNFPIDLFITAYRAGSSSAQQFQDRLRSPSQVLISSSTAAETSGNAARLDDMDGVYFTTTVGANSNIGSWMFRRAPGFFDEVCYTGTGSARTVAHNLGVAPELMILKRRDSSSSEWPVYAAPLGATQGLYLGPYADPAITTSAYWNNTAPTSSVFTVGNASASNFSGSNLVAYLFASCPGVSKVGSYTGTGTTQQINCGFTTGARFVLIKRADSTGDWYVWDSARGIVAGNDPYLLLNSTAAEVTSTDYIDTYSAGFEISSTAPAAINASGGSFIFLAIA